MTDKRTTNPHQIKFRLSDQELEQAQKETLILGMTLTSYAKATLLRRTPTRVLLTNEDAKSMMIQLQRIGTNVNQMARHLNSGIREGFHKELAEVSEELRIIRQFVSGAHGNR